MPQLGAFDTGFVYGETRSWFMHLGALLVVDPSTAPRGFDVERVRRLFAARLARMEPLHRRLVPVPLGLDRPFWVEVADVDLDQHIRVRRVTPPGGREELGAAVGDLLAQRLDRTRPLWEVWLLDGLEGGRAALLVKAHHSLFDGIAGTHLYEALYDLAPDTPFAPDEPDESGPVARPVPQPLAKPPGRVERWSRALVGPATMPCRIGSVAGDLARSGVGMLRFRGTDQWEHATFPFQAPRTSMNGVLSAHRSFAYCSVPMDEARQIKRATDVTLNDVVLAVCAGALRRYLRERGELPDCPLIAQIPLALDVAGGERRVQGNALSAIGASLATDVDDPLERLHAIHRSTDSAKAMHHALGDELIEDLAAVVPPTVMGSMARAYGRLRLATHHPPVFNLIVSSVPGPPCPVYVAGARVVGAYPIGPLLDGSGLNVTVVSHDGSLDFGFVGCPDLVPDPWQIADAAIDAFAELRARVVAPK